MSSQQAALCLLLVAFCFIAPRAARGEGATFGSNDDESAACASYLVGMIRRIHPKFVDGKVEALALRGLAAGKLEPLRDALTNLEIPEETRDEVLRVVKLAIDHQDTATGVEQALRILRDAGDGDGVMLCLVAGACQRNEGAVNYNPRTSIGTIPHEWTPEIEQAVNGSAEMRRQLQEAARQRIASREQGLISVNTNLLAADHPELKEATAEQKAQILVGNLFHEFGHTSNKILLDRWIAANLRLIARKEKPDATFTRYVRVFDGVPVIYEGFSVVFEESMAERLRADFNAVTIFHQFLRDPLMRPIVKGMLDKHLASAGTHIEAIKKGSYGKPAQATLDGIYVGDTRRTVTQENFLTVGQEISELMEATIRRANARP